MFSASPQYSSSKLPPEVCFSRETGDAFISSYFDLIHPRMPVLIYSELIELWERLWQPPLLRTSTKGEELLFMVLAIGARVSSCDGHQDTKYSEAWADHFSTKATRMVDMFDDPSLRSTHFMLLKVCNHSPLLLCSLFQNPILI